MSEERGLLQEVYEDLRHEVRLRRVQLLAGVAYTVLVAGGLYLFSSVGEDSHDFSDVHRRTTLAAVGVGLLVLAVLLCVLTGLLDRAARRRTEPGRERRVLPDRRWLAGMTTLGVVLVALGSLALTRWSG